MKSEIVKPFLEILKFIVDQGADINATVQKLKKFRDFDEEQRLQMDIREA